MSNTSEFLVTMNTCNFSICRLCLKPYQLSDKGTKSTEIVKTFLQILGLRDATETAVCESCENSIEKYFSFKYALRNKDLVYSSVKNKDGDGQCLPDVQIDLENMCHFCFESTLHKTLTIINFDDIPMSIMLPTYFPEVVSSLTKTSLICGPCSESLVDLLHFINNCKQVEKQAEDYRKLDFVSQSDVDMAQIQESVSKENQDDYGIGLVKPEVEAPENEVLDHHLIDHHLSIKDDLNVDDIEKIEPDYIDIQMDSATENPEEALPNIDPTSSPALEETCKDHPTLDNPDQFDAPELIHVPKKPHKCPLCEYESPFKYNLQRHALKHETTPDTPTYKCDLCIFETKHKSNLAKHSVTHRKMSEVKTFKCDRCSFQTKWKANLEQHLNWHEGRKGHKCELCDFETERKKVLRQHITSMHKDATKGVEYKGNLKQHLEQHDGRPKVKPFECPTCGHKTTSTYHLERHMLSHKDASEVPLHTCGQCGYQSKYRNNLEYHKRLSCTKAAPDKEPVFMYNCTYCTFQTKYKSNLPSHMKIHSAKRYRCKVCDYRTNVKYSLEEHMQAHMSNTTSGVYQCPTCGYETKQRACLWKHMIVHKGPGETAMYECDVCEHKTKYRYNMHKHMQLHEGATEQKV
ncbi:hypothetical protein NQ317_011797 [Molorchus minor]|uniref:C2H2-type domain-containing protein n=1 Tax=Molorchus minor TaxID=1323400 RepID=A0ABQ9J6X4_9CUCU|nr:hypothetical protein NQ317_011797 [Molorchus minor]